MYVVPPNDTWPRDWRRAFPTYVIPRSRALVRVESEGANLFDIPIIPSLNDWASRFTVYPDFLYEDMGRRAGEMLGAATARGLDNMILS